MSSTSIRVLVVDENPDRACLARRTLERVSQPRYHIDHATGLPEASGYLRAGSYDVVLLDLGTAYGTGLAALAQVRAHGDEDVPVIVLNGPSDEEAALRSLDEGAQDYIVKNEVTPHTLSRAIRYAIQRHQLLGQLKSANELLEQKNRRLAELYNTAQQFVDNVSHEFRTPLTVIREFTSIIRDGLDGPVTPKQVEHLDKVLNRTDDLALMVDDMLDISKLEAGLLAVWRRPCDVAALIENVAGLLAGRAESKKVVLETAVQSGLPAVFCDQEKAQRVIINLAVNAIKFTPEGGQVRIWAQAGDDGSDVVAGVTDSGPGISRENLEAIFQRFRQVDNNIRASTKGFGLGLNIAKELVGLNLGSMDVESEAGMGSTFSFTLPVDDPTTVFQRYVDRMAKTPDKTPAVSLIRVQAATLNGDELIVDEFLQHAIRGYDVVLRSHPQTWLVAASCAAAEIEKLFGRLTTEWEEFTRNCPNVQLPPLVLKHLGTWSAAEQGGKLHREFLREITVSPARVRPGRKVLVVDDDRELELCLAVRLQAAGYEVIAAHDGEQGLSKAIQFQPDAVVLDIRMPHKDGLTVLREMRSSETLQKTPVVVLSASVRDQQRALEQGANYFVQKPYEATTVLSAIESSIREEALA